MKSTHLVLILSFCMLGLSGVQEAGAAQMDKPKDSSTAPTGATTDSSKKQSGDSQQTGTTPSAAAPNTSPIESQVLAYEALDDRAAKIADFVHTAIPDARTLIVLDPTTIGVVPAFKAFQMQARLLRQSLCTALATRPNPPKGARALEIPSAAAFTAAAGALTAVLTVFKETRTVTPSSISLPDEALVTGVAHELGKTPAVYYPAEFPLGLEDVTLNQGIINDATDQQKLCNLAENDSDVPSYGLLIGLQFLRSLASGEITRINGLAAADKAALANRLTNLTAATAQYDAFANSLGATNSTTNQSQWDSIVRGEKLARLLVSGDTYVIQLKVQSAGGESVTLDGLFFLTGASYYYSGGAMFTAIVFDNTGKIVAAKNFWKMTGDVKRKDIASRENP